MIFPQTISFTEYYPAGTTLKLYGVIPCDANYNCVENSSNTFRWYTNTVETYNHVQNLNTQFGDYLPDLGADFIVNTVNDYQTGDWEYPADLQSWGTLGNSVECQPSIYCTEEELTEHSNIYDYESCCVGRYVIDSDEDGYNDSLSSMKFRMCPTVFFNPSASYGDSHGVLTDPVTGENHLHTRALFVKSSLVDNVGTIEELCQSPVYIAGHIVIRYNIITSEIDQWYFDTMSTQNAGIGLSTVERPDQDYLRAEARTEIHGQAFDSGQTSIGDDGNGIVYGQGSDQSYTYTFFENGIWRSGLSYCGWNQDKRSREGDSGCPGYEYGGPYGNWDWVDSDDPLQGIQIYRNQPNADYDYGTILTTNLVEDAGTYQDEVTNIQVSCVDLSGSTLRYDNTVGTWETTSCVMIGDTPDDQGLEFQLPYLAGDVYDEEYSSAYLGYLNNQSINEFFPTNGLKMYYWTGEISLDGVWDKKVSNFYLERDGRFTTMSDSTMKGVWELNRKTERLKLYGLLQPTLCKA